MRDANSNLTKRDKIAIIGFTYVTDLQLNQEQRYINPLGFKVNSYKVDDEYLH
jgi:type IV secretion system protein VirB8